MKWAPASNPSPAANVPTARAQPSAAPACAAGLSRADGGSLFSPAALAKAAHQPLLFGDVGGRHLAKYDPIKLELNNQRGDSWVANFADIEKILGASLPASAHRYAAWWSNDQTHVQATSWLNAGWRVDQIDLGRRRITFRKSR
jgi:hypothetical protein